MKLTEFCVILLSLFIVFFHGCTKWNTAAIKMLSLFIAGFVYWVFGWEMRHNVSTNVGRRFLTLGDKHFPKDHKLRKISNRNTIKISYSCMNNTKQIIDNHNKCILNPPVHTDKTANNVTADKRTHAHLTETASNHQLSTKRSSNVRTITLLKRKSDSQKRLQDKIQKPHIASFRHEKHRNSTELSKHIWPLKDKNIDHYISWRIISSCSTYNSSSKRCNLCLEEKFFIICRPDLSSLNKRNELVSSCRHWNKVLLRN